MAMSRVRTAGNRPNSAIFRRQSNRSRKNKSFAQYTGASRQRPLPMGQGTKILASNAWGFEVLRSEVILHSLMDFGTVVS